MTIYVTEEPKVGRGVIGWDRDKQKLITTTDVVAISKYNDRTWEVKTHAGVQYVISQERK